MKELKASDKVAQKMTHDGAVQENLATGEVTNISSREAEADFSPSEEPAAAAESAAEHIAAAHGRRQAKKAAKAEADTVREGSAAGQRPSSRLQFTEEERADPDLQKYIRRSDWAADRLDAAKEAIPKKKVLKTERVFDEVAGRGKTRLRFEEVEKKPNGQLRHNPLSRPAQEVLLTAHNEVHKVEQENVGVEAGHKGEELAERGLSYGKSKVQAGIRQRRMKPWRDAAKQKGLLSGQMPISSTKRRSMMIRPWPPPTPVSRYLQKKRIQRNYAKQVRQAGKTAKDTAGRRPGRSQTREGGGEKKSVVFIRRAQQGGPAGGRDRCLRGAVVRRDVLLLRDGAAPAWAACSCPPIFPRTQICWRRRRPMRIWRRNFQYELDNYESLHPG